jgi:hypothetical protein
LRGSVICRIRRAWYVHQGTVDDGEGDIELLLEDGEVLLVDVVTGDRLGVRFERWTDWLAPPLTPAQQDDVATYGKWEVFDTTEQPGYRECVGTAITAVTPLRWNDALVGVVLGVGSSCLRIRAGLDELLVDHSCDPVAPHVDPAYGGP